MRTVNKLLAFGSVVPLVVFGVGSTASAASSGAPGVTDKTITIGFVTSETGPAAASFSDSAGAAEARFALQNAHGGVDGRQLKLVVKDDESSPTTAATVASELGTSPNVFGIIEDSAIDEDFESGDKVLAPLGVPVTTWGSNTLDSNVFDAYGANLPGLGGTLAGATYAYNDVGPLLKSIGVTKLAGITYSSIGAGFLEDLKMLKDENGIATCYTDVNVPIGGVNFTVDALGITHADCNGVYVSAVDSTDVAVGEALKNAGSSVKGLYATGYDQEVLSQPLSTAALNDGYFTAEINMTNPNSATETMLKTIKKYDTSYTGGLPDIGSTFGYVSADLMIKGLEMAGANPTRSSFISNLRKLSSYDAGGIIPDTLTYTHFGTVAGLPKTQCTYGLQLRSGKYYSLNGAKPFCGGLVKLSG